MTGASVPLAYAALRAALHFTHGRRYKALLDASADPRATQAALLRRILDANAGTLFGGRAGFSQIDGPRAYQKAVPIRSYEELRRDVETQERTGQPILTAARPVYYHRTSGTVGAAKDIPVTEAGLRRIRDNQRLFAYTVARDTLSFQGKVLGITGQAVEGTTPSGLPYGSASGLLYKRMSRPVRRKYVLPPEVADIAGYDARYFAIAAHGLAERNVTGVGTANSSTLVRLLDLIRAQTEPLLKAVHDGRLPGGAAGLPAGTDPPRRPGRARELERVLAAAGSPGFGDIWPNLKGIMTWTGGSCGVPLRRLAEALPESVAIIELGYIASEFQGTVNMDASRNACLPTLLDVFFEFAERGAWEEGSAELLLLHELEEGREYYVFVTTQDGLYRYDMNDIVRAGRKINATPCLEFVQKGKGVTSITGEKLYEIQVLDAVMGVLAGQGAAPEFFVMLADAEAAGYTLCLEAAADDPALSSSNLADAVDRALRAANVEFDSKRASGRLAQTRIRWLRAGTGGLYRASRVEAGQRDAQFKYLHLQYASECPFDFSAHEQPRAP